MTDMTELARIVNARVPGSVDVTTIELPHPSGATLDAGGRVVVPAFVDAHVHLDKAFLVGHPALGDDGPADLRGAIAAVASLRPHLTPEAVRAGADRAVATLVRHGTTAAQAHVELDPAIGLAYVDLHRSLADAVADRCALQLVAFPQRGLELAGMPELLATAVADDLDVVGGCPYVDADPARHLDIVFGLADQHGLPVDLHLDFSLDPTSSLLGLVVERTRALGMQGRVTVGHVTTLAAMPALQRERALDELASCDIALVVLPPTDLHLVGAIAPVLEAARRGVRCAIANNNVANPFSPFGNANVLQAAWLAGVVSHAVTAADEQVLLEAITTVPRSILDLPSGGSHDLAVLDTVDADAPLRSAPAVVGTVCGGRLVHLVEPPGLLP